MDLTFRIILILENSIFTFIAVTIRIHYTRELKNTNVTKLVHAKSNVLQIATVQIHYNIFEVYIPHHLDDQLEHLFLSNV